MLELNSISLFFMLLAKCLYCNWLLFLFKHSSLSNLVSLLFTLCSGSPFPCSYSERLCLHLLDKWLLAANRPVNHSVRCGWIHPQVSHCMLKFTSWRTDDDSSICACRPAFHQCVCVCVRVCVCCGQDWAAEGGDGWHSTHAVWLWPCVRGELRLWQVCLLQESTVGEV